MSSYLLKSQARAMAAHAGDDGNHGFLVGTASLKGHNDVRLLRYSEEDEDISCVAAYGHTGEVVALAPCPDDASVIATTHNALPGLRTTIWRMPDLPGLGEDDGSGEGRQSSGSSTQDLIRLADIPGTAARVRAMAWAPAPVDVGPRGLSAASLVTVDDSSVRTFTLRPDGSGAALTNGADLSITDASYCGGVAWDPHHPSEVAVAADHSVMCWDTRSGEKTRAISGAVSPGGLVVRALSYNPNKPWHLATAGDDMRVKVWDLRRLSQGGSSGGSPGGAPSALVSSTALPVKVLDGHSHWVSSVAFNPYHDQLLLSGGTDGRVGECDEHRA